MIGSTIYTMKTALILSAVLALSGCLETFAGNEVAATRTRLSSGMIGCPPTDITITDNVFGSWTATCRGKTFYCTYLDGAMACKAAM